MDRKILIYLGQFSVFLFDFNTEHYYILAQARPSLVNTTKDSKKESIDLEMLYEKLSNIHEPLLIKSLACETIEDITLRTTPTLWRQHIVAPYADHQCSKRKPLPKARSDITVIVLFYFPKNNIAGTCVPAIFYFTTTFLGFFVSLRRLSFPFAICMLIGF